MRKITLICVGSLKEKYWRDALSEYQKRLSRFCDFEVIEVPEVRLCGSGDGAQSAVVRGEGDRILAKLKYKRVFVMAIEGELVSSERLADEIRQSDFGELCFVIGGSYGLDERVKKLGKCISFGRITLPHQLMRIVLSEQIYRAFTINNNIIYHK